MSGEMTTSKRLEQKAYNKGYSSGIRAGREEAERDAKEAGREEVEHLKWRATLKAASSPLDPAIAAVYDEIIEALS